MRMEGRGLAVGRVLCSTLLCHNSPAADELIVRVCVIGAHLVAIICVIVLILILIGLVLSWLQRDLQQQAWGQRSLGTAGPLTPSRGPGWAAYLLHYHTVLLVALPLIRHSPFVIYKAPHVLLLPGARDRGREGGHHQIWKTVEMLGSLFYTSGHAEAPCSFCS